MGAVHIIPITHARMSLQHENCTCLVPVEEVVVLPHARDAAAEVVAQLLARGGHLCVFARFRRLIWLSRWWRWVGYACTLSLNPPYHTHNYHSIMTYDARTHLVEDGVPELVEHVGVPVPQLQERHHRLERRVRLVKGGKG